MAFTLGRHIHACIDGEVPIFFDLFRDRYFRLTGDAEAAFRRLARQELRYAGDEAILADLVSTGVLGIDREQGPMLTPVPPLAAEAGYRTSPSARMVGRLLFGRCRMRMSRRHVRAQLLEFGSRSSHGPRNANTPDLAETMVASLMVSDLFIGQAERCLERALMIVHLLRRAGEPADLVLGVTSRPFAAHCWAQQGALLLGDSIERVRTFTPIAVL